MRKPKQIQPKKWKPFFKGNQRHDHLAFKVIKPIVIITKNVLSYLFRTSFAKMNTLRVWSDKARYNKLYTISTDKYTSITAYAAFVFVNIPSQFFLITFEIAFSIFHYPLRISLVFFLFIVLLNKD